MAWHLYVIPLIGDGVTQLRRPKLIVEMGVSAATARFGSNSESLVAADVSAGQDSTLKGDKDILAVPDDLNSTPQGAVLNNLRAQLEAKNIPGNWIQTTTTFREIIRFTYSMFDWFQRYRGLAQDLNPVIDGTVISLDSAFSALAQGKQTGLLQAATDIGVNNSTFAASTMRANCTSCAAQKAALVRQLGGITI